jgi:hypothetical protein
MQGMLEDKGHKVIALDYSAIPFKDIEAIDQAVDISLGFLHFDYQGYRIVRQASIRL